jgi:DNA-binding NarL/FixJ family response regulator
MGKGAVTVLIVDDHPVLRRGLVALLGTEPWVGEVIEAGSLRAAQAAAVTARPDITLLDLALPDGDGLSFIPQLRRAVPGCTLLVLTMNSQDAAVRAAFAAGANGYLLKDSTPEVIISAVRTVLDGGLVLGPDVPITALRSDGSTRLPEPLSRLSPAELRILALVGHGASNVEIAVALGISEKTVRNRLALLLAAIGAANRVQAALMARDAGLHLSHAPRRRDTAT